MVRSDSQIAIFFRVIYLFAKKLRMQSATKADVGHDWNSIQMVAHLKTKQLAVLHLNNPTISCLRSSHAEHYLHCQVGWL